MAGTVPWITISGDDLADKLVAAQVSAIRNAGKSSAQFNRDASIDDVIQRVRRKIENHYVLSATPNTVPPELRSMVIYLAIAELQSSIPGLDLTEDQKDRIETAEADLKRIADGLDGVSAPTDPLVPAETQASGSAVAIVTRPAPKVTRQKLSGI